MKVTARVVSVDIKAEDSESLILVTVDFETMKSCLNNGTRIALSIDGSTTNTGIGILNRANAATLGCMSLARQKDTETPVQYKVKFKRLLLELLLHCPNITDIFYEEPILGYKTAVKNLMMLRTSVEELIAENEPNLNHIKLLEPHNMAWKKAFLSPDKLKSGTELQKQQIREKLISLMPFLVDITEDEVDALAMGRSTIINLNTPNTESLAAKKKYTYELDYAFLAADSDEDLIDELEANQPLNYKLFDNGTTLATLLNTESLDKAAYRLIGEYDLMAILKFPSTKHGDVILKHKLSHLSSKYKYIYAFVWRKSKKIKAYN